MGSEWQGFVEESKSYKNYPTYWPEHTAALYLADGSIDPNYPGWTLADKRKAILEFWLEFPRAWFRFYSLILRDWLKHKVTQL